MKIMLDSGAYGAWKREQMIDVHEYTAFVKRTEHLWDTYINLDVIPPRYATSEEFEYFAQRGYDNLHVMKAAGLNPIPVFHQGEKFTWLDRMLADGEDYIALSPQEPIDPTGGYTWLSDCFRILDDGTGQPRVRVHGLGVTAPSIVRRFPWTSVDSTTWLLQSSFGQIPIPRYVDGKPDFTLPHVNLPITKRSTRASHWDMSKDWQRERVQRWMDEIGIDLSEAMEKNEPRLRVWVAFLVGLQKTCSVTIVFCTNTYRKQQKTLEQGGASHFLLSYFDLQKKTIETLENFIIGSS